MRSRVVSSVACVIILVGAGALWLRRQKLPAPSGKAPSPPLTFLEADPLPLIYDQDRPPGPQQDPFPGIPRAKVMIGGELRNGLLMPTTSRFTVKTLVPRRSLIHIGAGVLRATSDFRRPGVTFTVRLTTQNGARRTLFSRFLDPWLDEQDRSWTDAIVILLGYSGETVTLDFETALDADARARPASAPEYAVWSHPRLETVPKHPRPSVVLVSIDTLRADRLGCYGYQRQTSPALDQLASQGVRFAQAYAQAPWTTPSHASMLTGLYPSRHGLDQEWKGVNAHLETGEPTRVLHPSVRTLASRLREAGYATGAFTGGATITADLGFARGFDQFRENLASLDTVNLANLRGWLGGHSLRPFFLFLHTFEVHAPYTHDRFLQMPEARRGPLRALLEEPGDVYAFLKRLTALGLASVDVTSALYDGDIRSADGLVEQLLRHLHELGLEDRTLVIVTSDHGEEFADHHPARLYNAHGITQYEELLRVPLIVRLPGQVPASVVVDPPVRSIDIVPTVLDVLGLPRPDEVDGQSLVGLWARGGARRNRPLLVLGEASGGEQEIKALRRGRYKYIALTNGPSGTSNALVHGGDELYDLAQDPRERRNIAAEQPDVAAEMRRDLWSLVERARRSRPPAASARATDPELLEGLRALGYVQ